MLNYLVQKSYYIFSGLVVFALILYFFILSAALGNQQTSNYVLWIYVFFLEISIVLSLIKATKSKNLVLATLFGFFFVLSLIAIISDIQ